MTSLAVGADECKLALGAIHTVGFLAFTMSVRLVLPNVAGTDAAATVDTFPGMAREAG